MITTTTNDLIAGDGLTASVDAGISSEVNSVASNTVGAILTAVTGLPSPVGSVVGSTVVAAAEGQPVNTAIVDSVAGTIQVSVVNTSVTAIQNVITRRHLRQSRQAISHRTLQSLPPLR